MNLFSFISKKRSKLWIFLLCAGIVFFIQFTILQPVIQFRLFDSQDWLYLNIYRSLKFLDPNPFSQVINSWVNIGLHEVSQIYYIGILSDFFGSNYQPYQIANVLLKTAATISLFPLILIIFRNKLMAFLSTLIFGINSATAGSLQIIALGEEFLAVIFLNLFLIMYYYTVSKNSKLLLFLSTLFFLLTFLIATPRMFPLLLLIPLIEVYWLLKNKKLKNLKFSIRRLLLYFIPIILISLFVPTSSSDFQFNNSSFRLLKDILNGNWHNLLDPFVGIGWMLLTNDFWKFFGTLGAETFKSFGSYITFLFSGPFLIFGGLTVILSLILSKKPAKFFLLTFGLYFISLILMFFVANDNYRIFETILKTDNLGRFIVIRDPNVLALDSPEHFIFTKFPTILGIYILIVAFVTFLEWRKNRENRLLQAVWAGSIFSVIFHFPGWVIQGHLINDYSSIHRYFLVPATGISVFLAAILTMLYERRRRGKIFVLLLISAIIFTLLKSNQSAIKQEYLGLNPERIKFVDQQMLHDKFIDKFGDSLGNGDVLFYFDLSSKKLGKSKQYYKEALIVSDIGRWIKLRKENMMFTCMGAFTDLEALKNSIKIVDGQINFVFPGQCDYQDREIGIRRSNETHLYSLENLRAIRLENGEFIDIKEQLIKQLAVF